MVHDALLALPSLDAHRQLMAVYRQAVSSVREDGFAEGLLLSTLCCDLSYDLRSLSSTLNGLILAPSGVGAIHPIVWEQLLFQPHDDSCHGRGVPGSA